LGLKFLAGEAKTNGGIEFFNNFKFFFGGKFFEKRKRTDFLFRP